MNNLTVEIYAKKSNPEPCSIVKLNEYGCLLSPAAMMHKALKHTATGAGHSTHTEPAEPLKTQVLKRTHCVHHFPS
jgi:hypothetical protein